MSTSWPSYAEDWSSENFKLQQTFEIRMWGFKKNWRLTSSIGANEEAPCPRVKLERESAYEGFLTRVRELQVWLFHYILLLSFPWISHAHQTPQPQQLILSTEEQNRSACQQNRQFFYFVFYQWAAFSYCVWKQQKADHDKGNSSNAGILTSECKTRILKIRSCYKVLLPPIFQTNHSYQLIFCKLRVPPRSSSIQWCEVRKAMDTFNSTSTFRRWMGSRIVNCESWRLSCQVSKLKLKCKSYWRSKRVFFFIFKAMT